MRTVGDEVIRTNGGIVQYVGDQVMLSWTMTNTIRQSDSVRFSFAVAHRVGSMNTTLEVRSNRMS